MNSNNKATAMWISILIAMLIAAAGWVFGFNNLSAMEKLKTYEAVIMQWQEEKGSITNELKNMNRRLERIERLIEERKQ